MSTIRKLRRTMGTRQGFGKLQKPLRNIAEMPEDERQLMRYLIRNWFEQADIQQEAGISLDAAVQHTEELIDDGVLKIILDKSPKMVANLKDIRYRIVPAVGHFTTATYPRTPHW